MRGRVLIIAGSDSGGGAGIQADIKTVTAMNGFAMTAITALTAQNTLGVHGIHEVPTEFVTEQIRVVMEDIGADCLKTGMLHRIGVIEAVMDAIEAYAPTVPLVVDPVMIAKGGASLLEDDAVAAMRARVLPMATLITPNAPEAATLTGEPVETTEQAVNAARKLLELGPRAVLVKGGHIGSDDRVFDVFVSADSDERIFEGPRIETASTHGTGCTTASAIATGLAQGMPPVDALDAARRYVLEAIRTAPGYGRGHGPLNHAHPLDR
ncbi:MAG: bifunctional hydroxymethylpyrimidine kinase/phosphomethylpyrimidine kinase [Rhodospirillales bacterium]